MKNFICLSNFFWDEKWDRAQQVSLHLSNYSKVLFLQPVISIKSYHRFLKYALSLFYPCKFLHKVKENLYIYPLIAILPFGRNPIIKAINNFFIIWSVKKVIKELCMKDSIMLIWDFWEADKFIGKVNESLVIFDYYDNYLAFRPYSKKEVKQIQNILTRVFKSSDIVFTTSSRLLEEAKKYSQNSYLVPNGVDIENYVAPRSQLLEDIKHIPHPIIGYIGGGKYETCGKLDYELLLFATSKLSTFSFVFIGPVEEKTSRNKKLAFLMKRKNVHFIGKKQHSEVPIYLKQFDVCIIPWEINDYTTYIYPIKLNEYLACGKPIVSVALPDLLHFENNYPNTIKIARSDEDFAIMIEKAAKENDKGLEQMRIKIAKENSWGQRTKEMLKFIDKELDKGKNKELLNARPA